MSDVHRVLAQNWVKKLYDRKTLLKRNYGDKKLFLLLNTVLQQHLPQEPVEWRRSYGRPTKTVYVEAEFVPFSDDILLEEDGKSLIGHAFFHTYWTDCSDLDVYKSSVKDDISNWITKLKARSISDWLIISVANIEGKKINKAKLLSRTTVLDRIKNDFATKQSERCMCLLDPFKSDSRAAESLSNLVQRIRDLILQAYNKTLNKFEENMRAQREKRNENGWNFCDYFLLQEELAFVYEMLGLYDEALLQYDELDALFTQFLVNSVTVAESPDWLISFSNPSNTWCSSSLSPEDRKYSKSIRKLIVQHNATLLDFRNYLFSHQCSLLLLLSRPWEVAQRALPFVHNCVNEMTWLEIKMPEGSVSCWGFLTCLEVLQSCEKFNDPSHIESYSLYTADLRAYATTKLGGLGHLCGLMPDIVQSSQHLHLVVGLVSGMTSQEQISQPDVIDVVVESPSNKLRQALSSQKTFQSYYLEMSELAMGTYKHISRIKSARLIGIRLADFYMKLNEPHKACVFYADALKTYREENWLVLATKTQLQLVHAYELTKDVNKYIKNCAQLATSLEDEKQRVEFFDKMIDGTKDIQSGEPLLMKMDDTLVLCNVSVTTTPAGSNSYREQIISGDEVFAIVQVNNMFPKSMSISSVQISLQYNKSVEELKCDEKVKLKKRDSWGFFPIQYKSAMIADAGKSSNPKCSQIQLDDNRLNLYEKFEYKQDHSLNSSSIQCRNSDTVLSHSDSHHWLMKAREPVKEPVQLSMDAQNVCLAPGINEIKLSVEAGDPGVYSLTQLVIKSHNMEFIETNIYPTCSYQVIMQQPSMQLLPIKSGLLACVDQNIKLLLDSGSSTLEASTTIHFTASSGLVFKEEDSGKHVDKLDLQLPATLRPFEQVKLNLTIQALLKNPSSSSISVQNKEGSSTVLEHRISISCPQILNENSNFITLAFSPPFTITHKSHSAYTRKFIQIQLDGLTDCMFDVKEHKLSLTNLENESLLIDRNPAERNKVCANQQISYIWELDINNLLVKLTDDDLIEINNKSNDLGFYFSFLYRFVGDQDDKSSWKPYSYYFKLSDYKTLYVLKNRVEPGKGSEFCRANNACRMHIQIQNQQKQKAAMLMYEVVADQSMWAVCGRTAGVANIDGIVGSKYDVSLDVKPLIGGYLPLPTVRLSKYVQSENTSITISTGHGNRNQQPSNISSNKDVGSRESSMSSNVSAKLQPFGHGQVYNASRAVQIHVLPPTTSTNSDIPVS
ncbi:Trafficking protein particle complex subunit 10 [Nymphon striatum]|nr:Trafficking protein particle complex subunit 10 [Nymphon striatum]